MALLLFSQSVCEEEKEVYWQLLTMVSGGQSTCLRNGSSRAIVRSHRDLYVSIQIQMINISLCFSILPASVDHLILSEFCQSVS